MSLLLHYPISEASAILRGERVLGEHRSQIQFESLETRRLEEFAPALGSEQENVDENWDAVVRSFWSAGSPWGLAIEGANGEVSWNVVSSIHHPTTLQVLTSGLSGVRLGSPNSFQVMAERLNRNPHRLALAGHPGAGEFVRMEDAIRGMGATPFLILILAEPLPRSSIESRLRRIDAEEQFVQEEYLSRPGIERDRHTGALSYLQLIEATQDRHRGALVRGGWMVRTLISSSTHQGLQSLQGMLHGILSEGGGSPEPLRWQQPNDPRRTTFCESAEVAAMTRPPLNDLPGVPVNLCRTSDNSNTSRRSSSFANTAHESDTGERIPLGRILNDSGQPQQWAEIPIAALSRHLLVAGMTGSGKSTTCEHLLLELWREHRIPWLVIEPGMKSGYKRLVNSEIGSDLEIWTPGAIGGSVLPLNPLAAPVGTSLSDHTTSLFSVISSAFELVAPMPEVLLTAIDRTYETHGWNPRGRVPVGHPPQLDLLISCVEEVVQESGYDSIVSGNIRAGLLVRLRRLSSGPLARELNSTSGPDVSRLVAQPTIIELSAVSDSPTQALIMGLLSVQLRHHWRSERNLGELIHVTLIEEAHRLLEDVADNESNAPRRRAANDIADMLAEFRGLGAGLIIVDQTPSRLVPSTVANTGTKIVHRLDHPEDRDLIGRSVNLPIERADLLGTIPIGTAILRTDRSSRPFRVKVPNPALTYDHLPIPQELPQRQYEEHIDPHNTCSECDNEPCEAARIGRDQRLLEPRLRSLLEVLPRGESALREWAFSELHLAGAQEVRGTNILCFLVSLAVAAELPPRVRRRLREIL